VNSCTCGILGAASLLYVCVCACASACECDAHRPHSNTITAWEPRHRQSKTKRQTLPTHTGRAHPLPSPARRQVSNLAWTYIRESNPQDQPSGGSEEVEQLHTIQCVHDCSHQAPHRRQAAHEIKIGERARPLAGTSNPHRQRSRSLRGPLCSLRLLAGRGEGEVIGDAREVCDKFVLRPVVGADVYDCGPLARCDKHKVLRG
jgi:hypothetical protein